MYLDDKGTKVIEFAARNGFIRVRNIYGYGIMWKRTAITTQPQAETAAPEEESEEDDSEPEEDDSGPEEESVAA